MKLTLLSSVLQVTFPVTTVHGSGPQMSVWTMSQSRATSFTLPSDFIRVQICLGKMSQISTVSLEEKETNLANSVTHQAQRHSRSLVCFEMLDECTLLCKYVCKVGRTDTLIKTNDHL